MPPRRKRKLVSVESAPNLRASNLRIDPSLSNIDWTLLTRQYKRSARTRCAVPVPTLSAPLKSKAIQLRRSVYRKQKNFSVLYRSLPESIDKSWIVLFLAAFQSDAEFAVWSEHDRPRRKPKTAHPSK
jgi:hypothetical protein